MSVCDKFIWQTSTVSWYVTFEEWIETVLFLEETCFDSHVSFSGLWLLSTKGVHYWWGWGGLIEKRFPFMLKSLCVSVFDWLSLWLHLPLFCFQPYKTLSIPQKVRPDKMRLYSVDALNCKAFSSSFSSSLIPVIHPSYFPQSRHSSVVSNKLLMGARRLSISSLYYVVPLSRTLLWIEDLGFTGLLE